MSVFYALIFNTQVSSNSSFISHIFCFVGGFASRSSKCTCNCMSCVFPPVVVALGATVADAPAAASCCCLLLVMCTTDALRPPGAVPLGRVRVPQPVAEAPWAAFRACRCPWCGAGRANVLRMSLNPGNSFGVIVGAQNRSTS